MEDSNKKYPFVTAIIVLRNEEKYIEKCFHSLLDQDYPEDRYEIIIVDGLSEDNSIKIAKTVENSMNKKTEVRYFENPKKTLASGWNMAIKKAKGEYVVRIDAHGYASENFISNSVRVHKEVQDAVCVGGTLNTECTTKMGERIAMVLSSPFGVGNSKFRYSKKAGYVDTVAFGLYKKDMFNQVGYFDEGLKRNQDNDMHRRIKEWGGKFYLDPSINSTYISRDSVKGMIKQGFGNGKWNMHVLSKDLKSLSLRHLVPLVFVTGIVVLTILGFWVNQLWILLMYLIALHLIIGVIAGAKKSKRISDILLMPLLFLGLHLAYGMGSFLNLNKIFNSYSGE